MLQLFDHVAEKTRLSVQNEQETCRSFSLRYDQIVLGIWTCKIIEVPITQQFDLCRRATESNINRG